MLHAPHHGALLFEATSKPAAIELQDVNSVDFLGSGLSRLLNRKQGDHLSNAEQRGETLMNFVEVVESVQTAHAKTALKGPVDTRISEEGSASVVSCPLLVACCGLLPFGQDHLRSIPLSCEPS
jgi:hypothetical protein